jgi:P27 family predicted phage terminase small subunit
MKGRKPKLTVIDGGSVRGKCPSAPVWLTKQGKAEWQRAAPQLFDRKLLAPDTMATLESYCVAVGIVRECEEIMKAEGRFISTEAGPKTHPSFKMQSAAMREARLLAAELGLTPHRRGVNGKEQCKSNGGWDAELLA